MYTLKKNKNKYKQNKKQKTIKQTNKNQKDKNKEKIIKKVMGFFRYMRNLHSVVNQVLDGRGWTHIKQNITISKQSPIPHNNKQVNTSQVPIMYQFSIVSSIHFYAYLDNFLIFYIFFSFIQGNC